MTITHESGIKREKRKERRKDIVLIRYDISKIVLQLKIRFGT